MMKGILKSAVTSAAVAAVLASPLAQATNGYFKIGYGSKNRGMAGAGMAFAQDSLAPAVNPATLASVEDRVDAGLEIFKPKRRGKVDATGMAVPDLGAGAAQVAVEQRDTRHGDRQVQKEFSRLGAQGESFFHFSTIGLPLFLYQNLS